jgi:hypothetical protein
MAAVTPAANAQPADNPGLVPYPDLAQFYPALENAHQILDQFPKIHTGFGGKEKEDLGLLQKEMYRNKLHFQMMGFDLFFAGLKGVFFVLLVGSGLLQILGCGYPFDTGDF